MVFDRGLRDCRVFMSEDEWARGLQELNMALPGGPIGRITDEYIYKRYHGAVHMMATDGRWWPLVAADGR